MGSKEGFKEEVSCVKSANWFQNAGVLLHHNNPPPLVPNLMTE